MSMHEHGPTALGRWFLWGGLVLGLLFAVGFFTRGFGLLRQGAAEAEAPLVVHQGDKILVPENSPLRRRLSVMPASSQAVSGKLVLPGIIESDPARTAAVLTPLTGRVRELKVSLGDRVAAGQVLAVIDSPDLAQAYDDYDKAADTAVLTAKNLERQEGQHRIGAASDRDLDQSRSDNAQATSELTRARARLQAVGASVEARAVETPGRSHSLTLRAPLSGSVTNLTIAAGNMINDPTQAIVTIADLSTVWATALVPEKDIGTVAKGQNAEVALAAYPDRVFKGTVLFVSDVVEPDSRRNKLRIAFSNPDYKLKPNMFASVALLEAQQSRVTLPTSALLMNNDRTTVFVATAPWTFERRIVEPLLEEGSTVAIGSGLASGEQVVVKGGILLND
jgi:cobalt-zinc-cadmium efflux system membrane fusion protein